MQYKQQKQEVEGSDDNLDKQISEESKTTKAVNIENWYWLCVRVVVFSSILLAALAFLGVYVWHILAFPENRWLTDDELGHMRSFALSVASGVLATVLTNIYLNKK